MPSLSTIEGRIRDNVVDLPTATTNRIREWVNQAQTVAEERFPWQFMQKIHVALTVEDAREWVPKSAMTRYLRVFGTPFYVTGEGRYIPMTWLDTFEQSNWDWDLLDATQKAAPKQLLEEDSRFSVYPLPDALNTVGLGNSGNYLISVCHLGREPILTDAAQTNKFTDTPGLDEFLEHWATFRAMAHNRDNENANTHVLLAREAIGRAMRQERLMRASNLQFTPRRDVRGPRTQVRM